MEHHILNGDCLAESFAKTGIPGEVIVCRECLIDGPVQEDSLYHFWQARQKFASETFNESPLDYSNKVVSEIEKLTNISPGDEINLWFEDDLFCQTNMWFLLCLISKLPHDIKVFRVFPIIPNEEDHWKGFGISDSDMLKMAHQKKVLFNNYDLELGSKLWEAYRKSDFLKLQQASLSLSNCFQHLDIICQAHIDRFPKNGEKGRLERIIEDLRMNGNKDFYHLFTEFSKREGHYGFGDSQFKILLNKLSLS